MFGNLIRECGVLDSLTETANNTLTNLVTILLGLTISFTMVAAWKGYLALFIAMAIIFIGIAILNKVTNLKKNK